jgi:hypothetical protein
MSGTLAQKIADLQEQPEVLERLYRQNPDAFAAAILEARAVNPQSIALGVWEARLFLKEELPSASVEERSDRTTIWLVIFLCAISGTIAKLPAFFSSIDENTYYSRDIAFFFLPAIAGYFAARRALSWKRLAVITGIFVVAAVAINAYPPLYNSSDSGKWDHSNSNYLAVLHLPFFLWAIAGIAFAGGRWRDAEARISYLRLTGEAIIYFALIMITGVVMSLITFALFGAIKIEIEDWYTKWVVACGAASAPIVATHLAFTRTRSTIAPLIARIFSPLTLLTLLAYLGAILLQHRSPYSDREFLVVFNIMLLSVLTIAIFCICERKPSRFFDTVLCVLLIVALVIDFIALSAIIYRLATFGFTANRIATLVANILVFVNLLGILIMFAPAGLRAHEASTARNWIARFLPMYTIWTGIVVFAFPLIYRFK